MAFRLEDFEYAAYTRRHEEAARMLIELLTMLDATYGVPKSQFFAQPLKGVSAENQEAHVAIRLASAISCLFADENFQFAPQSLTLLFTLQRWFATIFASTDFVNADHVVRALNLSGKGNLAELEVAGKDLAKFCLLYVPESEITLQMDALWQSQKTLAASLCLALISPRFLGSPAAHAKRETLLPWLAERLPEIDSLETLPFGIMHDVYMHCSYADRADKHDVKGAINVLIERWLNARGLTDLDTPVLTGKVEHKPVMLVVMEWFNAGHSIYRTHSRTLESARELFHVVGMGLKSATDAVGHAVFDEWIEIKEAPQDEQIRQIRAVAESRQAQVFYMPSVGMFPLTMMLANIRLAPVMAMALGHPATSHSAVMDYVVVEEDYVGSPECFSEELLVLPKDGMPYRPSGLASTQPPPPMIRENPETVDIVVAASGMKINPGFLNACKEIARRSKVPVHFHFAVAFAQGMVYPQIKRVVHNVLGDSVTVYSHRGYQPYMEIVRKCDMFINPFPFGNTNGIIDTVTAGLVGVCKTGMEVNEHIDQGLFERFGLPDWLVATSTEGYINAAVKLAEDHELRSRLRREYSGPDKVERIFKGRPEIMGQMLMERVQRAGRQPRPKRKAKQIVPKESADPLPASLRTPRGSDPFLERPLSPLKALFPQHAARIDQLTPGDLAYHNNVLQMRRSPLLDYPMHVKLETYAQCNAHCDFCVYSDMERQGQMMPMEQIDKVLEDLQAIPRSMVFQLSPFCVNEPFLDKRIFSILEKIETRLPNAQITLTSNGSPLTDDNLRKLAKHNINYLWLSVIDYRKDVYEARMGLDFERTLERLDRIHQAKAEGWFDTRIVVSRLIDHTEHDQKFKEFIELRYPLFEVCLWPFTNWMGRTPNAPTSSVADIPCSHWFEFQINASGNVPHCCVDGHEDYSWGNVKDQSVLEIYNLPAYRKLRESTFSRQDVEPCNRCNLR